MKFVLTTVVFFAISLALCTGETLSPPIVNYCRFNPEKCDVRVEIEEETVPQGDSQLSKRETPPLDPFEDLSDFDIDNVSGVKDIAQDDSWASGPGDVETQFWKEVISVAASLDQAKKGEKRA